MDRTKARIAQLVDILNKEKRIDLNHIQENFSVSESTARRMCKAVEALGIAIRTYGGGLQLLPPQAEELSYDYNKKVIDHPAEKNDIGKYAASQIQSGDIIFISGGTTTACLVEALAKRLANKELSNVTIMTNSICNAEALGEFNEVIVCGGRYRPKRRDVAGYASEATIRGAHFNRSFIGVDGIELSDGLMALDDDTGNMDRLVTSRSELVYILADSSKFRTRSFISYEHFLPKHIIITDSGLDSVSLMQAKEKGIKIVQSIEEYKA